MRIVQATLHHLAEATLLLHEYYEAIGVLERDTPEAIAATLLPTSATHEPSGFWLAFVDSEPAGCVLLRPLAVPSTPAADPTEPAGECKRLYTRPAFRGRGLADALLNALESHARSVGTRALYLDSKADMLAAQRLYLRRGYTHCAPYNRNPQAAVFLYKPLSA